MTTLLFRRTWCDAIARQVTNVRHSKWALNKSDLKYTGGFKKKAVLTLETKSYLLTVLGCKPQPRFPPPQQDCPAWESPNPALQDTRRHPPHWKAQRRGVGQEELNRCWICYRRHKCPGGTADFFGRNVRESADTEGQAGCQTLLAGETLAPRSTRLQGRAGIAHTSSDGKGPTPGCHLGLH